jgi:hypothetical protein
MLGRVATNVPEAAVTRVKQGCIASQDSPATDEGDLACPAKSVSDDFARVLWRVGRRRRID